MRNHKAKAKEKEQESVAKLTTTPNKVKKTTPNTNSNRKSANKKRNSTINGRISKSGSVSPRGGSNSTPVRTPRASPCPPSIVDASLLKNNSPLLKNNSPLNGKRRSSVRLANNQKKNATDVSSSAVSSPKVSSTDSSNAKNKSSPLKSTIDEIKKSNSRSSSTRNSRSNTPKSTPRKGMKINTPKTTNNKAASTANTPKSNAKNKQKVVSGEQEVQLKVAKEKLDNELNFELPKEQVDTPMMIEIPEQVSVRKQLKIPELSSPLKSELPPSTENIFISPSGKKKVVFSEALESCSVSPSKKNSPLKSILKVKEGEKDKLSPIKNNIFNEDDYKHKNIPSGNYAIDFWQPGTIAQVESGSEESLALIDGCLKNLEDSHCSRKFEIYASINLVIQKNSFTFLLPKLQQICEKLINFIKRDMLICEENIDKKLNDMKNPQLSPTKASDPFENRIIIQSIKILTFFTSRLELVSILLEEDMRFIMNHICDNLLGNSEKIPKSVGSAYLSLIKDQKLSKFQSLSLAQQKKIYSQVTVETKSTSSLLPFFLQDLQKVLPQDKSKKTFTEKKYFISVELSERLLNAVINIQNYSSVSITIERTIAIRNLISEFPNMMEKHFTHWVGNIMLNIISASRAKAFSSKILSVSVTVLLEMVKTYLDNNSLKMKFLRYLNNRIVKEQGSRFLMESIDENESISLTKNDRNSSGRLLIDQTLLSLLQIMKSKQYKQATDIWVCITLLINHGSVGVGAAHVPRFNIAKWDYLSDWIKIHDFCVSSKDPDVIICALKSYKCIIYVSSEFIRENMKIRLDELDANKNGALIEDKARLRFLQESQDHINLLVHPLTRIACENFQLENVEVIEALHALSLRIRYSVFNHLSLDSNSIGGHSPSRNLSSNTHGDALNVVKFHSTICRDLWESVMDNIWKNFYLKILTSEGSKNLNIITEFYSGLFSVKPKGFCGVSTPIKILSNESVKMADIKSISNKWLFNNFDHLKSIFDSLFCDNGPIPNSVKYDFLIKFMNFIKPAIKKDKELSVKGYKTLLQLTGYIERFVDGLQGDGQLLLEYAIPIVSEYLEIVHANDLNQLKFITTVLTSLENAGSAHLRSIFNTLPTSKQLKLFSELARSHSAQIQQFIVTNLESRMFSNFNNVDCVTVGTIVGSHNLKGLDVETMVKKLVDQLIKSPKLTEDNVKGLFIALNFSEMEEFEAFLKCILQFRKFGSNTIDSLIILELLSKINCTSIHIEKLSAFKALISYELFPEALHETFCVFLARSDIGSEAGEIYQGLLQFLLRIGDNRFLNRLLIYGIRDSRYLGFTNKFVDDNKEMLKDKNVFDFYVEMEKIQKGRGDSNIIIRGANLSTIEANENPLKSEADSQKAESSNNEVVLEHKDEYGINHDINLIDLSNKKLANDTHAFSEASPVVEISNTVCSHTDGSNSTEQKRIELNEPEESFSISAMPTDLGIDGNSAISEPVLQSSSQDVGNNIKVPPSTIDFDKPLHVSSDKSIDISLQKTLEIGVSSDEDIVEIDENGVIFVSEEKLQNTFDLKINIKQEDISSEGILIPPSSGNNQAEDIYYNRTDICKPSSGNLDIEKARILHSESQDIINMAEMSQNTATANGSQVEASTEGMSSSNLTDNDKLPSLSMLAPCDKYSDSNALGQPGMNEKYVSVSEPTNSVVAPNGKMFESQGKRIASSNDGTKNQEDSQKNALLHKKSGLKNTAESTVSTSSSSSSSIDPCLPSSTPVKIKVEDVEQTITSHDGYVATTFARGFSFKNPEVLLDSDDEEYIDASEHQSPSPPKSARPSSLAVSKQVVSVTPPTRNLKRHYSNNEDSSNDDLPSGENRVTKKARTADSIFAGFNSMVGSVTDEELKSMSIEEKFRLESSLLQFMMRMRKN
ncbi:DNA-binding protein [Saccharomycopsis crataegensis]|uniref:DNA-binding protein n=1 Tax=Saccharomycopsis crataegensis TaxID=43959 RepID=A0AAV5QIK5_9ASCO|nr:DNA-binding protein [Saccharomycopsis crataegensis]